MAYIRVISGAGRYVDDRHDFARTSGQISSIVERAGHRARVLPDDPGSFRNLGDTDLMVLNIGGEPGKPLTPSPDWARTHRDFGDWISAGGRVLALHTAMLAFSDWELWTWLVGGQWASGRSQFVPGAFGELWPCDSARHHPVWEGLDQVSSFEERLLSVQLDPASKPIMGYYREGATEIMGWTKGDNMLYDGAGHDHRSYESPSRARLLVNEVNWLVGRSPSGLIA